MAGAVSPRPDVILRRGLGDTLRTARGTRGDFTGPPARDDVRDPRAFTDAGVVAPAWDALWRGERPDEPAVLAAWQRLRTLPLDAAGS